VGLRSSTFPATKSCGHRKWCEQLLSFRCHDGFAFALAESHPGCILLTGDAELRKLASVHKIEVHGILWLIDELYRCKLATASRLESVLTLFSKDATVRLPPKELAACLKRYRRSE
jgi:hypothetical protein